MLRHAERLPGLAGGAGGVQAGRGGGRRSEYLSSSSGRRELRHRGRRSHCGKLLLLSRVLWLLGSVLLLMLLLLLSRVLVLLSRILWLLMIWILRELLLACL